MRTPILLRLALCMLAACWAAPVPGIQEKPGILEAPAAPKTRAEFLNDAFKLIADGKFAAARVELDRAAAMGEGPCGECLLGLSHVYASEKKWDQAVDAAQRAIPLLKSPGLLARAYNQLGIAAMALRTPEGLAKAEEAFVRGAGLGGGWGAMARYNLAEVLFRRRSWAEAAEAAGSYLKEAGPDGMALKEARFLLCRSRTNMAALGTPAPAEDSEPLRLEGGVKRPEILFHTKPVYPEGARRAKTQGTVILETIVDQDGCVRDVKVLKPQPEGLTEEAVRAVRQWIFSPATLDGKPVKVYYVLTVNFAVG
ncbi:MAG: TonB family protein [Thermoanaerobaculia bacterium]